jgi:hypothetical protein
MQNQQQSDTHELDQLEILRKLLLREERTLIAKHEQIFEKEEELDQKIGPIIEAHLELLRNKFPEHYKNTVDQMIQHRLASSKDEIIGMLYPELGQMIKQYINHQLTMLRESIEAQIANTKRSLFFWQRKKHIADEANNIIASAISVQIEEIFLIKYPDGTIIGHAARGEALAPDAVAGMLTAISAFVSDAFEKQSQSLQLIQYQTHVLLLEHYHSYYFAALLSGPVTRTEQERLSGYMNQFLQQEYLTLENGRDTMMRNEISEKLNASFVEKSPFDL